MIPGQMSHYLPQCMLHISITKIMTLEELVAELDAHMESKDYTIDTNHYFSGMSENILTKNGFVRATWTSRLIRHPNPGEPRGPSEYYHLKFYPLPNQ